MAIEHIFNLHSEWVAYRVGRNVFDADSGAWVGWLPWDDEVIVNARGQYAATLWRNRWIVKSRYPPLQIPPVPPRPPIPPLPPTPPVPPLPPIPPIGMEFVDRIR